MLPTRCPCHVVVPPLGICQLLPSESYKRDDGDRCDRGMILSSGVGCSLAQPMPAEQCLNGLVKRFLQKERSGTPYVTCLCVLCSLHAFFSFHRDVLGTTRPLQSLLTAVLITFFRKYLRSLPRSFDQDLVIHFRRR